MKLLKDIEAKARFVISPKPGTGVSFIVSFQNETIERHRRQSPIRNQAQTRNWYEFYRELSELNHYNTSKPKPVRNQAQTSNSDVAITNVNNDVYVHFMYLKR